jgi:hypothetical protein
MEKFPDGKCIFRNPRCEERIAKKFEDNVHRKREKIMFQVQKEIDNEETKTARGKFRLLYSGWWLPTVLETENVPFRYNFLIILFG